MANELRIKRSTATNTPTSLLFGELAYSDASGNLFIGTNSSTVKMIGGDSKANLESPNFTGTPTAPTPTTSDDSTRIATTAFVKAQGYLTENQTITLTGDVTGSGTTSIATTLSNTGVTAGTYTKVTVDAKGRVTSAQAQITASDVSDFDTQVRTNRLDQMAAPTASVDFNSQKITNLADPTADQDAATKAYVDSVAQGIDAKESVKAATTANITLSGTQTVDGVSLSVDDRVLVKDQTTASENGVYIVQSGAWTRASDADSWNELVSAFFFVEEGTTNADNGYVCTVDAGGTLGTDDVTFVQFSGAGQVTAGAGLTKSGNTLNVGAGDGIQVDADSVTVKLDGTTLTKSASGLKVTDNTFQPLNAGLTELASIGTGIIVNDGTDSFEPRSLATADSTEITITNADGVGGNPTIGIGTRVVTTDDTQTVSNKTFDNCTWDGGTF